MISSASAAGLEGRARFLGRPPFSAFSPRRLRLPLATDEDCMTGTCCLDILTWDVSKAGVPDAKVVLTQVETGATLSQLRDSAVPGIALPPPILSPAPRHSEH